MLYDGPGDFVARVWIACTTLTIAYLPSRFVRRIYRERAVGDASMVPLVVLQGISHVWMLYGFMTETWFPSFPIFLVSDVAALCYNFIYWRFASDRRRVACVLFVLYSILALPSIYVIVGGLGYTHETRRQVARHQGIVCGVTLCTLNLVVLKSIYQAFKQKSSASMSLKMLLIGAANTSGWFTFGYLTDNWIISSPHTFVMALHAAALATYVIFLPRKEQLVDELEVVSIELSQKSDFVARASPSTQFHALRSPMEPIRNNSTAKTLPRVA